MTVLAQTKHTRLVRREDPQWERVVFAEVLVPETPNVFNDWWTEEAIREAAYKFMREGFGIDVNHDQVDRSGSVYIVETFIVREGDPDFIKGSWVVAMRIENDDLWQQVLDGEINGFSYEALMMFFEATLTLEEDGIRTGYTEYYVDGDGNQHRHKFMVLINPEDTRVIEGGTDEVNSHSHLILGGTVTEEGGDDNHKHRYTLVEGKDGR